MNRRQKSELLELDRRRTDGIEVVLLWRPKTGRLQFHTGDGQFRVTAVAVGHGTTGTWPEPTTARSQPLAARNSRKLQTSSPKRTKPEGNVTPQINTLLHTDQSNALSASSS